MPRKDEINKKYHSKNPRAKGNSDSSSRDAFSDFFFEYTAPGQGFQNLESLYNILSSGKIHNERDYWIYGVMNSIPGLSGYLQGMGQYEDIKSYMDTYDLDWSDIKPWRIANTGAGKFYRDSVNFVGDMVKELYS